MSLLILNIPFAKLNTLWLTSTRTKQYWNWSLHNKTTSLKIEHINKKDLLVNNFPKLFLIIFNEENNKTVLHLLHVCNVWTATGITVGYRHAKYYTVCVVQYLSAIINASRQIKHNIHNSLFHALMHDNFCIFCQA